MSRYEFVNDFEDVVLPREEILVVDPAISKKVLLFNSYYHDRDGSFIYEQDPCVNRYDLNKDIIDYIKLTNTPSMLWVVDPEFMDLNMAIELAKMGQGEYISNIYKNMYEIAVLRYMAGERGFFNPSDFYTQESLLHDADYASGDVDDYVYNFINENAGFVERDRRGYLYEEDRRDAEVVKKRSIIKLR